MDGPFSSAVARRVLFTFSLFLSLSLFLFLSLSLSRRRALSDRPYALSFSLIAWSVSFDIFVSLRTRELTEEEAPNPKAYALGSPRATDGQATIGVGDGERETVAAIVLGGGAGSRLYPLTKTRSKPAVPIGGSYRLIDVPRCPTASTAGSTKCTF